MENLINIYDNDIDYYQIQQQHQHKQQYQQQLAQQLEQQQQNNEEKDVFSFGEDWVHSSDIDNNNNKDNGYYSNNDYIVSSLLSSSSSSNNNELVKGLSTVSDINNSLMYQDLKEPGQKTNFKRDTDGVSLASSSSSIYSNDIKNDDIEIPNIKVDNFSANQPIDNGLFALGSGNGLAKIKQSCEACVRSKVKCSSTFPICARCEKRGTTCIYAQEKKRGRPLKNKEVPATKTESLAFSDNKEIQPISTETATNSSTIVDSDAANSFVADNITTDNSARKTKRISKSAVMQTVPTTKCAPALCWTNVLLDNNQNKQVSLDILETTSVERRVFHTFFSLYKHHSAPSSCCSAWFTLQLNKMRAFLNLHKKRKSLIKLTKWMDSHGVSISSSIEPSDFYMVGKPVEMRGVFGAPPVHAISPMLDQVPVSSYMNSIAITKTKPTELENITKLSESPIVYTLDGTPLPSDPLIAAQIEGMAKIDSSLPYLSLSLSSTQSSGFVNKAFTDIFGYNTLDIQTIIDHFLGGLLPWGGDVLSQLLSPEEDIIEYLHLLAIRFKRIMSPDMMPPTLPCVREPYIVHELVALSRTGVRYPCLCPSVVREILSLKGSRVEMHMQFIPKQQTGKAQMPILQQLPMQQQLPIQQQQQQQFQYSLNNTNGFIGKTIPYQPISSATSLPTSPQQYQQQQIQVLSNNNDMFNSPVSSFGDENSSNASDDLWMDSLLNWVDDIGNGNTNPNTTNGINNTNNIT